METFDADYSQIARKLRLDCASPGNSVADIRNGVKDWLDENSNWLMIVDNADTYRDMFGREDTSDDAIHEYLPLAQPGTAMILYTSRHSKIGDRLTECCCLPLGNLSIAESKAILYHKLGTAICDEAALELLDALEFLPMSIAHAAAYLKFTDASIQEYNKRLQNDDGLLELLDTDDVNVGRRDNKAPKSVVKALSSTLDLLLSHNKGAAHLFYFMTCLDRQSVSDMAIEVATNQKFTVKEVDAYGLPTQLPGSSTELEIAIGELVALALIERRHDRQCFTMHRLVQAVTIRHMFRTSNLSIYSGFAAVCLSMIFLPDIQSLLKRYERGYLENAQQFVPSVERVQQLLKMFSTLSRLEFTLLRRLGIYFYAQGEFSKMASCFADALHRDPSEEGKRMAARLQLSSGSITNAEAHALTSKFDFRDGEVAESDIRAMVELYEREAFGECEILSREVIKQSTAHSRSMVLARIYLASAVARIRGIEGNSTGSTEARGLILKAEEEMDGMSPEVRHDLPSFTANKTLAAVYKYIGDVPDAARLQQRACWELEGRYGSNNSLSLFNKIKLAEYQGVQDVTLEQLRDLELTSRALHGRYQALKDDRGMLAATDCLARVIRIRCCMIAGSRTIPADYRDDALSKAVGEAEGLLKEALTLQDRIHGVFARVTTFRTLQLYEFLANMGTPDVASAFVCHRAAVILEVLSDSETSNDRPGPELSSLIETFSNHEKTHLSCVRLLCTHMQRCKTRDPPQHVAQTMQASWCALERMQTKQVLISRLKHFRAATKLVEHYAFCDVCKSVRFPSICTFLSLSAC